MKNILAASALALTMTLTATASIAENNSALNENNKVTEESVKKQNVPADANKAAINKSTVKDPINTDEIIVTEEEEIKIEEKTNY